MSLLSTFAILFETDAKKATEETDGLAKSLGDVEKGAEGATKGTDNTTTAFDDNAISVGALTKSMAGMIASFIAFDAIATKVFNTASNIDTIGKLSQTIGLNIQELDAWGIAAERNGGSAEALRGTVESLQTSLQDISITGGGEIINTLAMIGVQATKANGEIKSAFEILPEIAEAFEGMSTEQSFAFGRRLGLDQGTILTLQQSRYEVDKLVERQKALGGVTKEGYERAAIFNDQWDDTKRVFNSLWLTTNNTILPALTDILKGFEGIVSWVKQNQTLVEGFFIGVAGVITVTYLPAIASAAAATVVAAAPFIAIAAVIAAVGVAVALLYEDVMAWVNGSKSAIGEVLGSFQEFKDKVTGFFDTVTQKWRDFVKFFTDTKKDITDFLDLSNVLSGGVAIQQGFVQTGFNADNGPTDTEVAQAMIAHYSSTQLNQGGASVNQRTSHNEINIGAPTIDARGMTGSQAKSVINASMKESVEMAIGQLEDGVQR